LPWRATSGLFVNKTMSDVPTILVIAPDPTVRTRIVEMLQPHGHRLLQAQSGTEARGIMPPAGTELVIVLDLAGGPEALRYLRGPVATRGNAPVVCLADRRETRSSSEALRLGVADLVGQPVREAELLAAIANAREVAATLWRQTEPPPALDVPADTVFGSSPAITEVLALVRRVAPSRCAVLLAGDRGSGREMVARRIHGQGAHREAPFVKIACLGAPPNALDALFAGEIAAGATVYLENIQELPADQQRRLADHVRSDSDASVEDAGEGQNAAAVRFIGAVPARLVDPTERQQIRRELIDALGVVRIDLPPLRQRVQDIPLLATHFLKDACRRNGVPVKAFSRSALMLLSALPWPGNAAELRSLAERLAILVPRGSVLLEDVLLNIRLDGAEAMGRARGTLREAREDFERNYIVSVLQHHRGRMGAAAHELGIERTNLYRKIKQHNISLSPGPV
jgi:DNA-binding NtrC family response regulator